MKHEKLIKQAGLLNDYELVREKLSRTNGRKSIAGNNRLRFCAGAIV